MKVDIQTLCCCIISIILSLLQMLLLIQDITRPLLLQYDPTFYVVVEEKCDQLMDCSSSSHNVINNNNMSQIEINHEMHTTQDVNFIEYSSPETSYPDDVVEVCKELVDTVEKSGVSFEADIKLDNESFVYTTCVEIVENLVCSCVEVSDAPVVPVSPHLECASQTILNVIQDQTIQEDNPSNIVITPPNTSLKSSNEEQCSNMQEKDASQDEFESIWNKRKREVEISAETAANGVFRQWKRDRVTLEQAINSSLKEYSEMYEKAHALRLLFEEEKGKWAMQVAESYRKDEFNKRQRVDSNYTTTPLNHGYNNLHSEFQYTTDEEGECDHQNTAATVQDQNILITPQKKVKKFSVPLKT